MAMFFQQPARGYPGEGREAIDLILSEIFLRRSPLVFSKSSRFSMSL